jgi:outer membrane protein
MKNTLAAILSIAALLLAGSQAYADDGPWELRVHATYLSMANDSDAFTALNINFPSNSVRVNSKWIPEFDVSYSFTRNLSAELVLTIPQTQTVTLNGVGDLGTFKHLPPVLSAQYHVAPSSLIDPYVGLGANFTLIYGSNLSVAHIPLSLDPNSIGIAAQVGCDFNLGHNTYFNVDVKKVELSSGVYVPGGTQLTTAHLDPWLLSAGFGWHF